MARARRSRGSHCPFLILLVCLVQLASRFPAALAFVVGIGGASRAASTSCPLGAARGRNVVAMADAGSSSSKDLLVVGMGTLGSFLGRLWREEHGPGAAVFGETFSTSRHDELRQLGVTPTVRSDRGALGGRQFAHVVFCVPPSKNEDYVAEVEGALALWSGEGGFVFTSSGGVFAEDNGGTVHEGSPVTESPRMAKILAAERAVVEKGGLVLRLAGLYTKTRGPHTFWLSRGEVGQPEDGVINLLHYEDAARATLAGLLRHEDPSARTLLVADDMPMTRKEICAAAVASPFFRGQYGMPAFKPPAEGAPSLGKMYDTSRSRRALGGWVPKYASFASFMAAQPPPEEEAQEGAPAAGGAKSGSVAQGRSLGG